MASECEEDFVCNLSNQDEGTENLILACSFQEIDVLPDHAFTTEVSDEDVLSMEASLAAEYAAQSDTIIADTCLGEVEMAQLAIANSVAYLLSPEACLLWRHDEWSGNWPNHISVTMNDVDSSKQDGTMQALCYLKNYIVLVNSWLTHCFQGLTQCFQDISLCCIHFFFHKLMFTET